MLRKKPKTVRTMKGFRLNSEELSQLDALRQMASEEFIGEEYGVITQTDVIRAALRHALETAQKRGIRRIFS